MSYELHVLRAAADGVQPALLLRAPGKKAEYLFNVPDGFSRLALEQKLTPSARLSCVLLTSLLPASTGGFGGLFLRLKHDGHGQVQVIGPQGSSSIIHSLRHICRWQHPKILVSECCDCRRPVPVFEDEYMVIVPLVDGDQLTGCPWCRYESSESFAADPLKKKVPVGNAFEMLTNSGTSSSSDCSGSGSDTSSNDTASTGFVQSTLNTEGDLFEKSLSEFNACSEIVKDDHFKDFHTSCKENLDLSNGAAVDNISHSCHMEMDGRDLTALPHQRKRGASISDEEIPGAEKDELHKVKKAKSCEDSFRASGDGKRLVRCSSPKLSSLHDDEGRVGLDNRGGASEDGNLVPRAKGNGMIDVTEVLSASASAGELLESSIVQSTKPYDWLISNVHQDDLPQAEADSNPIYELHPSAQAQVISGVEIEKDPKHNKARGNDPTRVLGYVSYLRKLNTAILVVDCGGTKDLETLRRHPALCCLYGTGTSGSEKDGDTKISIKIHSISAIIHLTPQSLVESSDYQLWMASFKNPAHVVMNESSPEFGFQSSIAMLKRLNSIQRDVFPLPFKTGDPNCRTTQLTQELINSNVKIVDAVHSLCLRFCEEGTTWSHVSVENSLNPLRSDEISSIAETSQRVQPELLSAEDAEAPRSNATICSNASANVLAAIGIKRRLLLERETTSSRGTFMQNMETLPNSNKTTLCKMKNCMRQGCVCRSDVLSLTTKRDQENSSGLSQSEEDNICADTDKGFNAEREVAAARVVLKDKQAITSFTQNTDYDLMLSQTRGLTPVQEYVKFHDPASEFQLVFLGTGCAEPSKKRGSSSILLQVKGAQGAMLLDAGEGAAGQLVRRFGEQAARTIISSLQCLWLSHKHGDHVLGVLAILQTRSAQAPPLLIIGPHKVGQWLSEVRDTCSARGYLVPQFTYMHCEEISGSEQYYRSSQQHRLQLLQVLDAMQLDSMLSVKVFHCYDAYGIILKGRGGWEVVYSGDTRPCKQLIEAGQGCTLLIHEATFEDTLVEQAKCKRHSTVSEAANVGRNMRAQHIILTHFSQRYPEMVVINRGSNENLSVAFDGMVVPSQLLGLLGKLLPQVRIACQKPDNALPITDTAEQRTECTSRPKPVLNGESAVQQNYAGGPLEAKHKRWSSDSDDEAKSHSTDDHAIGTLTWSLDSEEKAELNEHGGLLLMRNDSRSSFRGILDSSALQRARVSGPSSYTRETAGPLGGKHVRWIDSDSEDG